MFKLTKPFLLIKNNEDQGINIFLENSIKQFYDELDFFCVKNQNTNFGQWFSESGFLSMFINAIIRGDNVRTFSAVQEYCVTNHINGGSGRCDGFIEFNKNVILIEAKKQKYLASVNRDHFDIDKWMAWDKDVIQTQLRNYLTSEEKFFLQEKRYESCYMMTIIFKIIKENMDHHITEAKSRLKVNETKSDRTWYYSTSFIKNEQNSTNQFGLEVYGTIEKALS